MILLLFSSMLMAQSLAPDHKANQYLQQLENKRQLQKKQGELLKDKYQYQEGLQVDDTAPNANTYGVIREAPEEVNPSFEQPDVIYSQDPFEQARQEAEYQRQNWRYQEQLRRDFVKKYMQNAEADGTGIHLHEDLSVEEAGRIRQPSQRPTGSGGQ